MQRNIAEEVRELILTCLNGTKEGAILVEGIVNNYAFSPEKIKENREKIRELLNQMSLDFHKDSGGGMSFLRLPFDKEDRQWGEHKNAEELLALGIAAGMATYCMPREMWNLMPGSLPYVVFDTGE